MVKVQWEPQPKQAEALSRTEFEVLYGGARGGGKTDAGMAAPLYYVHEPLFRGLVIRKNADDLKDWIDRARRFYIGRAECVGNPPEFRFKSGAILRTGHLNDENAFNKYLGHEYQFMLIEELTQIISERNYLLLISSCRSTVPNLKPQVFSTTNPGGVGHRWVKKRFIDVAPYGTPYIDPITGRSRVFIQALVEDNQKLMENDPDYAKQLEALPPNLRRAWRYGDWEDYEVDGSYYGKEMKDARQSNRITRVPHDPNYQVRTAWDLGMDDSMSIWFYQIIGREIRIIDYFESSGEGLAFYIKILREKPYIYDRHYAPFDIEVKELGTGKTRKETARSLGLVFETVKKHDLEDGINAVRSFIPRCYFDAVNCEQGIACLDNYRKDYDEKNQIFRSHPVHDIASHGADSFRYLVMGFQEPTSNDSISVVYSRNNEDGY